MNLKPALQRLRRFATAQPNLSMAAPSLSQPMSQACTASQFDEPAYAYWCDEIHEAPRHHRKQWEFCYILQVLAMHGMLAPGRKGLGFGVGAEPLAAVMAQRGVEVLATDLEPARAEGLGWVQTQQHAASREALNSRGICQPGRFERNVRFENVDMNHIPQSYTGFDFCWSACAMEHLGSIEQGLAFVMDSLCCLKPGGVAVHTTEFNCTSDSETLTEGSTVLFRQRDLGEIAHRAKENGYEMMLNFSVGDKILDRHVDAPPYSADKHLKLAIDRWTVTSYGLVLSSVK